MNSETDNPAYETPAEFRQQASSLVESYLDLKDAMVESDAKKAAFFSQAFQESLNEVAGDNLSAEADSIWSYYNETLIEKSVLITNTTDIEEQRIAFDPLSMALIQSMEAFGPFDNAVYQQSCPMFGNGSAHWLSGSDEIENPYFGDKMLNCGEVVRSL